MMKPKLRRRRYRYRCGRDACRTRKSLRRPIDEYLRRPHCPGCDKDSLRLDNYRMKHETGRNAPKCYCGGLPWSARGGPHRPGSKWCIDYAGEYDELDMQFGPPGASN